MEEMQGNEETPKRGASFENYACANWGGRRAIRVWIPEESGGERSGLGGLLGHDGDLDQSLNGSRSGGDRAVNSSEVGSQV